MRATPAKSATRAAGRATAARRLGAALLVALLAGACGGDGTEPTPVDLQDFIAALATSGGVDAVFHAGTAPASSTGPTIAVTGSSAMITGGSAIRSVTSAQAFSTIVVTVQGVDGYWEITLPGPVTAEELVISLAQNIPAGVFTLRFAGGDGGTFGAVDTELVQVVFVGTGQVQVSVTWNSNADVDLYVIDPANEEIYWEHRTSASGGQLDLDSNGGCVLDNIRNENVTWPTGTPPSGTYTVKVNLWEACGALSTDYVVTVLRQGSQALTFNGTLTGPGNQGGAGAGDTITAFTF